MQLNKSFIMNQVILASKNMALEISVFNPRDLIEGGSRDWLHKGYQTPNCEIEIPMDILCGGSSAEKFERGQTDATSRFD